MSTLKNFLGLPAALRPRIAYKNEDGSHNEVYGHGCQTFEQAHAYCRALSPNLFVMNEEVPTQPTPLLEGPL